VPSTSKKQRNFMAAVAHNPEFAKKAGVPQSVGKEFNKADKGRTFAKGGDMKSKKMAMGGMASQASTPAKVGAAMDPKKAAMIAQAMKKRPKMMNSPMSEGPKAKTVDSTLTGLKSGGKVKKMASGGMTMVEKGGKMVPDFAADGVGKMKHGGVAKKMNMGGMAYARGGGIETKGKTKGTMVKMAKGGSTKKYC